MSVCTFFGHRNTPDHIKIVLKEHIIDLILRQNVDCFMVGSEGNFDYLVQTVLKELRTENYRFEYSVVLAYLPLGGTFVANTVMFPDFEKVPRRYAVDRRNTYLLKSADIVVGYVLGPSGGAHKFLQKAIRQSKTVINLAEHIKSTP